MGFNSGFKGLKHPIGRRFIVCPKNYVQCRTNWLDGTSTCCTV